VKEQFQNTPNTSKYLAPVHTERDQFSQTNSFLELTFPNAQWMALNELEVAKICETNSDCCPLQKVKPFIERRLS
jgi:hypothetical protein